MLDYKAIGRKIAYYRKVAYLTQGELAEKLCISESYMSQVECGKVEVSLKRLNQIAETLNVELTTLLSDTNPASINYGCSEILDLVKKWSPEQKGFLLRLIRCADEEFYPIDKKK